MYFENSKKSYYRFPSKASVTEFDAQIPYYFPTTDAFNDNTSSKTDTASTDTNTTHTETTSAADNTVH